MRPVIAGRVSRWLLPAALGVAAAGLALVLVFGPATGGRPALPPGLPLLLIAAVACVVLPGRVGGGIALAVIGFLVAVSLRPLGTDLTGGRGPWLVAARLVEVGGLAVAGYAGVRRLIESRSGSRQRPTGWTRPVQVFGLLGLSAVGAELLSAYGDSTGDPGQVAFAVVFFGALYGAPGLLARELVRRRGWGWPSMLLLFVALGIAQACLIDQSLFSADYQGYEGWQEARAATFIPAFGISALSAYSFVVGHVIFSFAAPVALAEGWAPQRAHEPWLGRVATVIAAIAYLGAAAMILSDPESHSASPPQLAVSIGLVVAAIAAAVVVGRAGDHDVRPRSGGPPLVAVMVISMVPELTAAFAGQGWLALVLGVVTTGALGVGILLASRRWGWSVRHSAAVGVAFLLVRGGLAFTYFPLIGDVEPVPKYLHNVVMIVVVIIAGAFALRRPADQAMPSGRRPARTQDPPVVSRPGGGTDRGAGRSRRRGGSLPD